MPPELSLPVLSVRQLQALHDADRGWASCQEDFAVCMRFLQEATQSGDVFREFVILRSGERPMIGRGAFITM
jgi:hypothetical protein